MMVDHSGADRLAQGGQHVWFCGLTGACGFLKLDVVKGASTIKGFSFTGRISSHLLAPNQCLGGRSDGLAQGGRQNVEKQ